MATTESKVEDKAAAPAAPGYVAERDVTERLAAANAKVRNHSLVAAGLGLLPMPVIDLVALTGTQLNLLRELGNLYGTEFKEDIVKKLTASLINGYVPLQLAAPLASALKAIPLFGQSVGGLSMSVLGGGITYAIGKVFVQHFESGGTFLDFDPASVRAYFRQQFMDGVKITATSSKP